MSLRILSSNTRGLTGFAGLLTHPSTSAFPMSCFRFLEFRISSLRFLSTFNHHPSTIIPDRASVAIDSMCNTRAHSSGTVQDSHLIPFSSIARKRGIWNKTEGKISAKFRLSEDNVKLFTLLSARNLVQTSEKASFLLAFFQATA